MTGQRDPVFMVGGLAVAVRPPDLSDGRLLADMHARCTDLSRLRRWLAPLDRIPPGYLARVLADTPDHVALVAATTDESPALLALVSAGRTDEQSWEVGVLVEDRFQNRGLGRYLIERLVARLPEPWSALVGDAFVDNPQPLRQLARFGRLSVTSDHGVVHAVVVRESAVARDAVPADVVVARRDESPQRAGRRRSLRALAAADQPGAGEHHQPDHERGNAVLGAGLRAVRGVAWEEARQLVSGLDEVHDADDHQNNADQTQQRTQPQRRATDSGTGTAHCGSPSFR